jgi:hypothetical protein
MAMRFAPHPLGAGASSSAPERRRPDRPVITTLSICEKVRRHSVNHLLVILVVAQVALH